MIKCIFCGESHEEKSCPMFGSTKSYLDTFAPKAQEPKEEPPRSSLAPTQFEEIFGTEAEPLLLDVMDGQPNEWTPEQQELATEILQGDKNIKELSGEELDTLNTITQQMTVARKIEQPVRKSTLKKPAYVSTWKEMENFSDTPSPFQGLDTPKNKEG